MDRKKPNLKETVLLAGKRASVFVGQTKKNIVKKIDQNGDGKLDLDDINVVKNQLTDKLEEAKRNTEIKSLCPVFEEDLDKTEFILPKMVRIVEKDKKHSESAVCQGSIGHESVHKGLRVVNIYPNTAQSFGLQFYPNMESEVYYVDPSDRDRYIALDDYYHYMKVARVSELQRIAMSLGAKHFRVVFKEQNDSKNESHVKGNAEAKAAGKGKATAAGEHSSQVKDSSTIEVAAEMEFIGHKPIEPELMYFKKDPQIQSLIAMRMAENGLTHQIYRLSLSQSSGIKEKDAVKIDAAVSAMKASINATISKEAQAESKRYFEYEIDF